MKKHVQNLSTAMLVMISTLMSSPLIAKETYNTMYDYLTKGGFECRVNNKNLLKPGLSPDAEAVLGNEPTCFYNVTCVPRSGSKGLVSSNAQQECPAPKGVCQELVECAKADSKPSASQETSPKWSVLPIAPEVAKRAGTPKCWLEQNDKSEMGVFQFYDGARVAEQVCITSYACENDRILKNLAASPITIQVQGKSVKACPNLTSAIEKQIEMPPAVTEKELLKLAEVNPRRADVLRSELAAPARVAAATVPGNAVSSTSFQPRTANIIGSRASVSNPPASKPPATGHTGRGMK